MRAVVQRVSTSSVRCGDVYEEISKGFNVLLGVQKEDTSKDADYMVSKISSLRVFEDDAGKMNLSLKDVDGEILLISQFTLLGDARHGARPSFINAAAYEEGRLLYEYTARSLRENGLRVRTGVYGGDMEVTIVNDGPVTILLDSGKLF
ncbi:MAG: D-tyrosyl-tRNA(Tyr) deacylase [Eubacteriaceae bacterium]|nr:D-tyrosyl-tRNA(Tyr) deacylase [Eubacteriaceae bacterium]